MKFKIFLLIVVFLCGCSISEPKKVDTWDIFCKDIHQEVDDSDGDACEDDVVAAPVKKEVK